MKPVVESLASPRSYPLVAATSSYAWIETLIINTCGYASVIVPGFLIIQYLKLSNYLQRHGMLSVDVLFVI